MDKNKIFGVILTLISFLLFLPNTLFAQEGSIDQYFKVEYDIGRQSVWNNSIPINIYIKPREDYNRVEITFNESSMTEVRYKGPQYFPVQKNETYKVQARIYPKERGSHFVSINAIAWEHNTNYTSTASALIEIDENLQIVPQTTMYKILRVLKFLFITSIIVGIGVATYFTVKKNMKKIKKWFEPEF